MRSKVTSRGQVTIPAPIRSKLGLAPDSVVEWCERGGEVVLRRAGTYSSLDIHRAVFSSVPERRTVEEMDEGIEAEVRRRHPSS